MADFLVRNAEGQTFPVIGISEDPHTYANSLARRGLEVLEVDGQPYTYPVGTTQFSPYPPGREPFDPPSDYFVDDFFGRRGGGGIGVRGASGAAGEGESDADEEKRLAEAAALAEKERLKKLAEQAAEDEKKRKAELAEKNKPFQFPEGTAPGKYLTLTNPVTGAQEMVLLDGTPETSAKINDLVSQGYTEQVMGVVDPPTGADPRYGLTGRTTYRPDTTIPAIDLPQPEAVDWRFPEGFNQWYSDVIDAQTRNLGELYDFDTPRATPAQLDIYGTGPGRGPYGEPAGYGPGGQPTGPFVDFEQSGRDGWRPSFLELDRSAPIAPDGTLVQAPPDDLSMAPPIRYDDGMTFAPDYYGPEGFPPRRQFGGIPQPRAQTPQQFEALQFLLSGQGFDPATLARMRAGATDAAAMAGRSQAGTARLLGQQAGLEGSPAALALEASARRRQGDVTTRALNEIEIANAMQGMQNRLAGAGMELGRQTSGAAMANQMALANASNILSGMQQNVANQQQTNLFNTGNLLGQRMTQAGQQAQLYGTGAQDWNRAQTQRANQAAFFNPGQQMTRDLNQAELDRQKALTEAGYNFDWGSRARDIRARQAEGGQAAPYYSAWLPPTYFNPFANLTNLFGTKG